MWKNSLKEDETMNGLSKDDIAKKEVSVETSNREVWKKHAAPNPNELG